MSSAAQTILEQLTAAAGTKKPAAPAADAADFDWRKARFFNAAGQQQLHRFSGELCLQIAAAFQRLFHCDFEVTVASFEQYFAGSLPVVESDKTGCIAELCRAQQKIAMLTIPMASALSWTTRLLGDQSSADTQDRQLSHLETMLLVDVANSIIEPLQACSALKDINWPAAFTRGKAALELPDDREVCTIIFDIKPAQQDQPACQTSLIVPCDTLAQIAGIPVTGRESAKKDCTKLVMTHINRQTIEEKSRFSTTLMSLKDLWSLSAGDILVLDKKVNEPMDLLIGKQEVFRGTLAGIGSNKAVVITELCSTKSNQIVKGSSK